VVVTPGVDMALVSKNALQHGRRVALLTALGINAGIVVWTAAAALGVAALIRASATAFTVLKLAGAAYLVFLGLQAIWPSRRGHPAADEGTPAPGSRRLDPPVKRALDRLTGLVLVAFGVRLATEGPRRQGRYSRSMYRLSRSRTIPRNGMVAARP
jgi:threonine/homoserine/homoserine lactone efflux protein